MVRTSDLPTRVGTVFPLALGSACRSREFDEIEKRFRRDSRAESGSSGGTTLQGDEISGYEGSGRILRHSFQHPQTVALPGEGAEVL